MPRVGGVYSAPAGTKGVPNTTIQSAPYNAFVDDLAADANNARPITAGGTGATSSSGARTNLGLVIGTDVLAFGATTAYTRTLLDDANAPAARATLEAQQALTNVRSAQMGINLAGAADAYYDFFAGLTGTYSARIIRESGNNGNLLIAQTGTGVVDISGGSNLTRAGSTIWHAGNDGPASGLDADVLDGQQGSYYANIPARLGYTPVNKAGDVDVGTTRFGGTAIFSTISSAGTIELCNLLPYIDFKNNSADDYDVRLSMDGTDNSFQVAAAGGMKINGQLVPTNAGGTFSFSISGSAAFATSAGSAAVAGNSDLLDGQDSGEFMRKASLTASPPAGFVHFLGKNAGGAFKQFRLNTSTGAVTEVGDW